ncbi:peptidoglycan DD-metalloendopeptidase family protein [Actinomadura roseirufa]|uniref:peptidoglycan DD-metalloendopeptidase family protein n=1 Tax=Actinomadura roseirufa TaxID=2094049 RepID=UPI001A955F8A|nr:peptidoglycan DD-metalloendopeptidase family protein [Actinomadura roseirufa]
MRMPTRRLAAVAATAAAVPAFVALSAAPALAAPAFQMPFPCGQTWSGQTRSDHSPANAVDFNRDGDDGDAVTAAASGTVARVENLGTESYGLWIEIDHGGGWRTRYAHLSGEFVSVGQGVAAGQQIGTLGTSGKSSGPHLHFEERSNGSAVKISFNGAQVLYWGSGNYTSGNGCAGAPGTVHTGGISLTVRTGPHTTDGSLGTVPNGGTVFITCYKRGSSVAGTYGTSDIWDKVGSGYVADSYLYTGSDQPVAPAC